MITPMITGFPILIRGHEAVTAPCYPPPTLFLPTTPGNRDKWAPWIFTGLPVGLYANNPMAAYTSPPFTAGELKSGETKWLPHGQREQTGPASSLESEQKHVRPKPPRTQEVLRGCAQLGPEGGNFPHLSGGKQTSLVVTDHGVCVNRTRLFTAVLSNTEQAGCLRPLGWVGWCATLCHRLCPKATNLIIEIQCGFVLSGLH